MEQMEKVETLREKTGCSYSEAKAALTETDGDLLEALCWLESHGKTQMTGAFCSTEDREPPAPEEATETEKNKGDGPFVQGCRALWQGIVDLFRWGNQNELVMKSKSGKKELGIPLTLLVLLMAVAFWLVLVLIVVALFCGCRFSVEGPAGSQDLNDAIGKATDFAEGIKDEVFPKEDHTK